MELDDLKGAWAAHTATLERSLAIQQRVTDAGSGRGLREAAERLAEVGRFEREG